MSNHIHLDGVIVSTWTYNHQLFARLAHHEPDGTRVYFNLAFPDPLVIRETREGNATLRTGVRITQHQRDRLAEHAVVLVTGQLAQREDETGIDTFLQRCSGSATLPPDRRAALLALAPQLGTEVRAVYFIHVRELVYL